MFHQSPLIHRGLARRGAVGWRARSRVSPEPTICHHFDQRYEGTFLDDHDPRKNHSAVEETA
jgi:hypothetical protein